jgi:hypothetical protein
MSDPKDPRINVTVRLSKPGIEAIDFRRNAWSRSDYIRHAISEAVKRDKRGPKDAEL